jgi:cardiolipin synthase
MNIGDRHLAQNFENPSRVVDVHFRVQGPVVAQIEQVFLEDWHFATGEHTLQSYVPVRNMGEAVCRTIVEGPNEDLDSLATILVGVVSSVHRRLSIMTPYFLPSRELIGALKAAALRGVAVNVILPAKNDIPFVHWATRNMLWELLERGIRVHYQPPPFVHTKLLVVDGAYAQIGSANIDPRSLRLNFELVIEVYNKLFAESLETHVRDAIARSREISLEEVDRRPLPVKTRDALAWLFSPYL